MLEKDLRRGREGDGGRGGGRWREGGGEERRNGWLRRIQTVRCYCPMMEALLQLLECMESGSQKLPFYYAI